MLDFLRPMGVFVRIVEAGSFRAAAKTLDLSPSVVSHHVAQLESRLGIALLYRSTRRLSLTRHGEEFFAAARQMLDAASDGLDRVANLTAMPIGELSITAPSVLSAGFLVDDIAAFAHAFPRVRLHMDFTDTPRDVIAEGIDVAIRMGRMKDSTLKSRKLRNVRRILVAAPDYMAARRVVSGPSDLAEMDWIRLRSRPSTALLMRGTRLKRTIKFTARLVVNDAVTMYRLSRAGLGLAIVPEFLAAEDLAAGRISEVIPEWRVEEVGAFALWPPNATRASLTALFIRFLEDRVRESSRIA